MVRKIVLLMSLFVFALPAFAQTDAKGAVNSFFSLLKTQKYAALYEYLPSDMQQRVSREQLTASLKRLSTFITIEKMEIGRVQQKGDFAVIDTSIFGKVTRGQKKEQPAQPQEGKVAVQQYLFKEKGHWKVATADSNTRAFFLKKYPEFKQGFEFSQPRFFIKQDGEWKAMN
ncbi:MAG: hypothetical protein U0Y68_26830 [Blastocatellia bacterium]